MTSSGALVVESPADVEKGFSDTAPLLFHFGHKTPEANLQLYNLLISRIAEVVNMRCDTIPRGNDSLL
jgi:polyribonucleotide 5'-hydroxyl-kinase